MLYFIYLIQKKIHFQLFRLSVGIVVKKFPSFSYHLSELMQAQLSLRVPRDTLRPYIGARVAQEEGT